MTLRNEGFAITPDNLSISGNAVLILPVHRELDALREKQAGKSKIGTTGKGIGPAYEDKTGRRAIRVGDLDNPDRLQEMTDRLLAHHNCLRSGMGVDPVSRKELGQLLDSYRAILSPFIASTPGFLRECQDADRKILFEGAQGTFLDIDHGTYPFVTSSSTIAGSAAAGSGVPPGNLGYILGICKAYTTRVGSGPFPTEQKNHIGEMLGRQGNEFGTVTGRPRRCGWLDLVLLRTACMLSGVSGMALMKLDVLDGLEKIRVCTHYRSADSLVGEWPNMAMLDGELEPVYETLPGWSESTNGATTRAQLPDAANRYIDLIEDMTGYPIRLISTSPRRQDIIRCGDGGLFA